jgi:hypothetical protein
MHGPNRKQPILLTRPVYRAVAYQWTLLYRMLAPTDVFMESLPSNGSVRQNMTGWEVRRTYLGASNLQAMLATNFLGCLLVRICSVGLDLFEQEISSWVLTRLVLTWQEEHSSTQVDCLHLKIIIY